MVGCPFALLNPDELSDGGCAKGTIMEDWRFVGIEPRSRAPHYLNLAPKRWSVRARAERRPEAVEARRGSTAPRSGGASGRGLNGAPKRWSVPANVESSGVRTFRDYRHLVRRDAPPRRGERATRAGANGRAGERARRGAGAGEGPRDRLGFRPSPTSPGTAQSPWDRSPGPGRNRCRHCAPGQARTHGPRSAGSAPRSAPPSPP